MVRLEDQMNNENLEMLQQIFEVCPFPLLLSHSFNFLPDNLRSQLSGLKD